MTRSIIAALLLLAAPAATLAQPAAQTAPAPPAVDPLSPKVTGFFNDWMRQMPVPGLAYGIVKDGKPFRVEGLGVQDVASLRQVTPDSRFRIASMSKAFTALAILKLRDEGKLSLEEPAATYVPEMRGWKLPTSDARPIRVSDLIHHSTGFVEDNPWGDRQQPLTEAQFSAMLRGGVDFAQPPATRMEYSNLGYALLGRIVTNVSGRPYQRYVQEEIMAPLGMRSTGFEVFASPAGSRSLGFRWQDKSWVREPDMADGAFGAMGGVETTASDYARWVAFLLSAWPARDGPEAGPVRRSTVRELIEGATFPGVQNLPPEAPGGPCRQANGYGHGMRMVLDCALGTIVTHSGGYPGYGSIVLLLPDAGVGVFAFANRTYAAPLHPSLQTLHALRDAGLAAPRALPVSPLLAEAYAAGKRAWTAGDATAAPLANNVLLDRGAAQRRSDIAALKSKVGACAMGEPIAPVSAMEGTFEWSCASGKVRGRVQRAPTRGLALQVVDFREAD